MEQNLNQSIAYICGGSLKGGLTARLNDDPETIREGSFVVAESDATRFYGLVTDIRLESADPRYSEQSLTARIPPRAAELLRRQTLYTEIEIMPALMQKVGEVTANRDDEDVDAHPGPVKTVPRHMAPVRAANAFDIREVFGDPAKKGFFTIGYTREQGHPVAIDLEKMVQRSSGIFGATGSGKSYLTRMILAGLIHHDVASVLIFDMHDEYAFGDVSSDTGLAVQGLKDRLKDKVRVVSLGAGAGYRQQNPDFSLELRPSDISKADILMLGKELSLRDTTPTVLTALESAFGSDQWLTAFMEMPDGDVEPFCETYHVNQKSVESLRGKLRPLWSKPYIRKNSETNPVSDIISSLKDGKSVILSFGKYNSDLDYLLISNILTRLVRADWVHQTEAYEKNSKTNPYEPKPKPLVIAVEEAHKLLNPEMAKQTAFGEIAREMRKFSVTLLVIDQRPSQIYDEVMSQLGTRVSGWLGDDADIGAVLSGLAGKESLRGMLAHLQPKQEVLVLGYTVPMPIPLASRRYDNHFWEELTGKQQEKQDKFKKHMMGVDLTNG